MDGDKRVCLRVIADHHALEQIFADQLRERCVGGTRIDDRAAALFQRSAKLQRDLQGDVFFSIAPAYASAIHTAMTGIDDHGGTFDLCFCRGKRICCSVAVSIIIVSCMIFLIRIISFFFVIIA